METESEQTEVSAVMGDDEGDIVNDEGATTQTEEADEAVDESSSSDESETAPSSE